MGRGPDYMDDGERVARDRLDEIAGHLRRITDPKLVQNLLAEANGLVRELPEDERAERISQLEPLGYRS